MVLVKLSSSETDHQKTCLKTKNSIIVYHPVGGFNPSETYQSVGILIPSIWKSRKCGKPPTSHYISSSLNHHYIVIVPARTQTNTLQCGSSLPQLAQLEDSCLLAWEFVDQRNRVGAHLVLLIRYPLVTSQLAMGHHPFQKVNIR